MNVTPLIEGAAKRSIVPSTLTRRTMPVAVQSIRSRSPCDATFAWFDLAVERHQPALARARFRNLSLSLERCPIGDRLAFESRHLVHHGHGVLANLCRVSRGCQGRQDLARGDELAAAHQDERFEQHIVLAPRRDPARATDGFECPRHVVLLFRIEPGAEGVGIGQFRTRGQDASERGAGGGDHERVALVGGRGDAGQARGDMVLNQPVRRVRRGIEEERAGPGVRVAPWGESSSSSP